MEKIIRYPYEKLSLVIAISVVLFISYAILEINYILLVIIFVSQLTYILIQQKQIQGLSIKITKDQYSRIYAVIVRKAEQLQIDVPDSFITFDPMINAFVMGFKKPYTLVLNSALVEAMDEEELSFIIGHELGHIKLNHSRFKSLVSPLDQNLPVITFIFNQWLRKSEYSADRSGILLSGKPEACIRALLKMAVGAKLFRELHAHVMDEQIEAASDTRLERMSELFLTHPYITNRIKQVVEFYQIAKNQAIQYK